MRDGDGVLRRLSSTDRWMLSLPPVAAYNVVRAIRCGARVRPAALRDALALLQHEQPALVALVRGEHLVRRVAPAEPVVEERARGESFRAVLVEHANRPFAPAIDEPLYRAALVEEPADSAGSDVILSVAHALADGLSLNHLARRLVHWLAELRARPFDELRATIAPCGPTPDFEDLFPLGPLQRLRGAVRTGRELYATLRSGGLSLPMRAVPFRESSSAAIFRQPGFSVAALHEQCRRRSTTVGAALHAALLRAGCDALEALGVARGREELPVTTSITITMRPHARVPLPPSVAGNYGAIVRGDHVVGRGEGAWSLCDRYRPLHEKAKDPLVVPSMLALRALMRRLVRSGRPRKGLPAPMINVTNLGRFESDGGLVREVYALSPSSLFAPLVNCQLITVGDRACFSFTYVRPATDAAHVALLADRTVELLAQMAMPGR